MDATGAIEPGQGRRGERTVLVLVCAAHFVSHVHILVLAPLFPFLKAHFDVSYVELALALTLFNATSALMQAPMGFVADRVGAQRVLIAGLVVGGLAVASIGVIATYPWLLVASLFLGAANATYHPSDYAILAAGVGKGRVGRAFSFHTFAGYLGAATAPVALVAIATSWDWRAAMIAAGLIGPAVALPLLRVDLPGGRAPPRNDQGGAAGAASAAKLLSPSILRLTGFFLLLSLSNSGLQYFSVVAFTTGYGIDVPTANGVLAVFLTGTALGVLAGGFVADLTRRHGEVAAAGFAVNAAITLGIALGDWGAAALVAAMGTAGFLSGLIMPSRDMLVREAAPPGAAGRVFGIVSTGFNLGGLISPMLFGWIMDRGSPRWVFGATALVMMTTVATALIGDRRRSRDAAAVAGE